MIKTIFKIFSLIGLQLAVLGSVHSASIGFNSSLVNVNQSDSFSLIVQGSDFSPFVGGGLNMSFDASVLNISSVTINTTVFDFAVDAGIVDNNFGRLLNTSFNSFAGASGDFDIMTINFTAVGAGSSELILSESLLWVFADTSGNLIGDQISYASAMVNVQPVPVPAALWLFGSGMITLSWFARRRC